MSGAKLPLQRQTAPWLYRISLPVTQVLLIGKTSYPICPRCDCSVDREYMNFCDHCGQKLGWEFLDFAEEIPAPRRK